MQSLHLTTGTASTVGRLYKSSRIPSYPHSISRQSITASKSTNRTIFTSIHLCTAAWAVRLLLVLSYATNPVMLSAMRTIASTTIIWAVKTDYPLAMHHWGNISGGSVFNHTENNRSISLCFHRICHFKHCHFAYVTPHIQPLSAILFHASIAFSLLGSPDTFISFVWMPSPALYLPQPADHPKSALS